MANDAGNDVEYWLSVPDRYSKALYALRAWPHLKMAAGDSIIWVRGLSYAEVTSPSVLEIPLIERYYLTEAQLYPFGRSLPAMIAPSLLWTPLYRGLKVRLPKENFNYFGVAQTHRLHLMPCAQYRPVAAAVVDLSTLGQYLHAAPRVRVEPLQWVILGQDRALVVGTPLLPIRGEDYYRNACFLIPAGWKLRYASMVGTYRKALEDLYGREYWYILDKSNKLFRLNRADLNQLSKGSFVKTTISRERSD